MRPQALSQKYHSSLKKIIICQHQSQKCQSNICQAVIPPHEKCKKRTRLAYTQKGTVTFIDSISKQNISEQDTFSGYFYSRPSIAWLRFFLLNPTRS